MRIDYLFCLLFPLFLVRCSSSNDELVLDCSESEVQHINLNEIIDNKICVLEDLVDKVRIVPLETNEQSLIHEPVSKILYTEKRLYIQDGYQMSGVICFDKQGRFINRLKQGNGPGEVPYITDIAYDSKNEQIVVLNNPFLFFYDMDLNYIKSKQLSDGVYGLSVLNDGYLFIRGLHYKRDHNDMDNYIFEVTDTNFISKKFFIRNLTNYPRLATTIDLGDKKMISIPGSDTIYSYSNGVLKKEYVLEYKGKKVVSFDDYIVDSQNAKRDIQIPGVYFIGRFEETDNYQVFYLEEDNIEYRAFRNKKNGRILGGCAFQWDSEELLATYYISDTYRDTIVSLCWPEVYPKGSLKSNKYISDEDRQKLENLDDEDNPFMILYTLKDFDDEE